MLTSQRSKTQSLQRKIEQAGKGMSRRPAQDSKRAKCFEYEKGTFPQLGTTKTHFKNSKKSRIVQKTIPSPLCSQNVSFLIKFVGSL